MGKSNRQREILEQNLQLRLKAYSDWPKDNPQKAAGASSIADDIARSYRILGEQENAQEYFEFAAKFCSDALAQLPLDELKPDQAGHEIFHCARRTWYAEDAETAQRLFEEALDQYRRGYEHEQGGVRRMCRQYSIYCHIFLGNYADAERNAEIKAKLEATSGLEHPGSDVDLMQQVARLLQSGTRETTERALAEVRNFMKKQKLTEYGARPHPVVDVKDYILSLLGENGEEAEGPEQAD